MTDATTKDLDLIGQIIITGDLARLSDKDRAQYYREVCAYLDLNPLTRPFQYLQLNGRLTLYCAADGTNQLRRKHHVSVDAVDHDERSGIYIVTARARDKSGRTDAAIGAVAIEGLKGDARANAMMKAETKAKRRVTLSLVGLGMLDESEVEGGFVHDDPTSVTGTTVALPAVVDHATGEVKEAGDLFAAAQPAEERSVLLGRIRGAEAKLRLSGKKIAELWHEHCGSASEDTVDPAALSALLTAVRALEKAAT